MRKVGRKPEPRARAYRDKFAVNVQRINRRYNDEFLAQLDRCADDEARRILINATGFRFAKDSAMARKPVQRKKSVQRVDNADKLMALSGRIARRG